MPIKLKESTTSSLKAHMIVPRQQFTLSSVGGIRCNLGRYATPTATLSGTATPNVDEATLIAGGATIIITLTGRDWVPAGATFNAQRQAIIDGMVSGGAEPNGWNAERVNIPVTAVVRTSDTVVTVTLPPLPDYVITTNEAITVTVPAAAIQEWGQPIVAGVFIADAPESSSLDLVILADDDVAYEADNGTTITGQTAQLLLLGGSNEYNGLRFSGASGLSGATIINAVMSATFNQVTSPDDMLVYAEIAQNPGPFAQGSTNHSISNRPRSTASVPWPGTDLGDGRYQSPNLASLIQELIASHNPSEIAIIIETAAGTNLATDVRDAGVRPTLHIEYTPAEAPFPGAPITRTGTSAADTNLSFDMPAAGIQPGMLLTAFVNLAAPGAFYFIAPIGWDVADDVQYNGGQNRLYAFTKQADGTENNANYFYITNIPTEADWVVIATPGVKMPADVGENIAFSADGLGSSIAPDAPSLTAPWGALNTRWMVIKGSTGEQASIVPPAGYTEIPSANTRLSVGYRDLNAASENPGAFSGTAVSSDWGAVAVAMRPGTA